MRCSRCLGLESAFCRCWSVFFDDFSLSFFDRNVARRLDFLVGVWHGKMVNQLAYGTVENDDAPIMLGAAGSGSQHLAQAIQKR